MNTLTSRARRAARVGVALAVGVLAAGGAALASTANAAVAPAIVSCPLMPYNPDHVDSVTLAAVGFDFGTGGLSGGAPACPGTLEWDRAGGALTPRLNGTLYLKNSAGATARMRLKYYDVHQVQIGSGYASSDKVALDDDEEFAISMSPYSNVLAYRVDVTIQVKVGATYTDLVTSEYYLGSKYHTPDDVTIAAVGQDLGNGGLVSNAPAAPAELSWLTANNTVQAELTGEAYQKNSIGVETRVLVTTFDVFGNVVASRSQVLPVPGGNTLVTTPVSVSPAASPLTYSAKVELQNKVGGVWTTVGSAVTVSI